MGQLRRIARPDLPIGALAGLIEELVRERIVMRNGPRGCTLPEHVVRLSDADEAPAQKLQPLIAEGRFDPPWVRELAAALHESEDHVRTAAQAGRARNRTPGRARPVLRQRSCGRTGRNCRGNAREHGGIDAGGFRDAIGPRPQAAIQIRSSSIEPAHAPRQRYSRSARRTAVGDSGNHEVIWKACALAVRLGFNPAGASAASS